MDRRSVFNLSAIIALGLALLPGAALAQQKSLKEQLIGAWTLVSNDNVAPDGTRRQNFGPNPTGILILDASGQFTYAIRRPDRLQFKSNNRLTGTPEENEAVVRGSNFTFGTWSVEEAGKFLILHIEGSLFPNLEGADSRRPAILTGDELKLTTPNPSSGGSSDNVFKRAK
jgi:Lipocalin-like domain